ncbi:pre-peptidase C-terminal domain-containing protein [Dolichospermum heterosporum]|uniref:Pre-peptidase C-terminal domain-containing protein n=1 Tax=Dolichospermum heterosporum TAC447 TaxID=747523 RepID=A0ABY5LYW9_9CYAN|nr:pre-peptidase C-terminal domain-containing protein [Dolichospermum heterosporum]UUO16041.1 pre-peptidase C-terminal domain-containing protein [Dolichospermum heterosporum TAC447]
MIPLYQDWVILQLTWIKDPLNPNPTELGSQQLPPVNAPLDYAGNTRATARNVGTLTGSQSFNDWVGSSDTNDYYSFNVGTQSNLSLNLTGLTANADVQLLNSSGGVITTSAKTATTSESIASLLSAGAYFVRVYRSSGDTNYSLSLNATPVDSAGNTLVAARNVGTLTGTQSFSDWVGSVDTNDYYSFNVGTQSNFSLSLTGLTANADVELLDSSGGVITTSANTDTTSESITSLLGIGTYYARVYQFSGDTNYSLSLNATPVDNAGNTRATARKVETLTGTQSFSDWVGSVDTNDYYSFNVGTQSNLSLNLTGLTANADVQLLNSSGGVITTSAKTATTSESITSLLNAGSYFVRVYRSSGNTNYSLSLTVDNAGNTLAKARNVGTLTATQSFSDWIGTADTNDYYSFNVGTQSNFSLNLTGLTADADVELFNSSGTVISGSYTDGIVSESIASLLSAGAYYVRVFQYSGDTNYSLSLNAIALPVDNAGNTLPTARNVGTLTATQSFSDWTGTADTNDYYNFNVGTQSNFSLNLTGLTADADVELFNSSGTVISYSYTDGIVSESITSQLSAGAYYVRVFQYSGDTNYSLSLNAIAVAPTPTPTPTPIPTDWYSQNLLDAQIITLTRSLAADGNLSRNDMISIFRDAKDGSVIDANELTDLRTLVSNSTLFTMVDYVKVLSNKIANGNAANIRSGFGNLFADSSDTQMENLIGKWFLGTDRPDTGYTYSYASGSLFQNGASADDIYQGAVGDCYYVATLASIAQEKPEYIQNMFTDNGDNTFTVRFYNNGVADYVTVDRYLPTYSSGNAAYAGWGGGSSTSTSNELWVALAEKAYAQLAESGWSRTYSGTQNNSYAAIEGGWMDTVIRQVTGLSATSQSVSNMTQTQLINLVNSNQVLTAGFVYGAGYGVVDGHAYTITAYNATNGTFHLRNPWGSYHADVTWSQLLSLSAILQWSNT